jgi:hypothetical protein
MNAKTFLVVGPGRKPKQVSFDSEYEAAVTAQNQREAGMSIILLYWAASHGRYVSVTEDDEER